MVLGLALEVRIDMNGITDNFHIRSFSDISSFSFFPRFGSTLKMLLFLFAKIPRSLSWDFADFADFVDFEEVKNC